MDLHLNKKKSYIYDNMNPINSDANILVYLSSTSIMKCMEEINMFYCLFHKSSWLKICLDTICLVNFFLYKCIGKHTM